jgi:hypothetical protein
LILSSLSTVSDWLDNQQLNNADDPLIIETIDWLRSLSLQAVVVRSPFINLSERSL